MIIKSILMTVDATVKVTSRVDITDGNSVHASRYAFAGRVITIRESVGVVVPIIVANFIGAKWQRGTVRVFAVHEPIAVVVDGVCAGCSACQVFGW